jgi:hypothetical protein
LSVKRHAPERFERVVQSWDTANKATELSDFSVCTTWGVRGKNLYLLGLLRQRLEYPALKHAVREQQSRDHAHPVLCHPKCSGNVVALPDHTTPGAGIDGELRRGFVVDEVLYILCRTDALFPPKIAPDVIKALTAAGVAARYFELDSNLGLSIGVEV